MLINVYIYDSAVHIWPVRVYPENANAYGFHGYVLLDVKSVAHSVCD